MNNLCKRLLPLILVIFPFVAFADSWKDESGHGHEFKEKYWDGNCKVERKLGKHGEYKEKRKCKGPDRDDERAVLYAPPQPAVFVEPGITIQGTVRIPQ